MKYLVLVPILFLGACTNTAVLDRQVGELKALGEYHTAERQAAKAKQVLDTAVAATGAATVAKLAADVRLKKAKAELDRLLTQTK